MLLRGEMSSSPANRWFRFLRNYGPIPTNDNMYDETIQRARYYAKRLDRLLLLISLVKSATCNACVASTHSHWL
jgi:hypothetical protein